MTTRSIERLTLSDGDVFFRPDIQTSTLSERFVRVVPQNRVLPQHVHRAQAVQIPEVMAKALGGLLELPPNWNSYGAPQVSPDSVLSAWVFISQILRPGLLLPGVVPTPEGGVQLEWHGPGQAIEVEFRPGSEVVLFSRNEKSHEEYEGNLWENVDLFETRLRSLAQNS